MSSLPIQARRATLEDLPRLKELWALMRFSDADLERQLTDFQVATDAAGHVIGAVALQISQRHGRIHSEAFEDFSHADQARPALWTRIENLAANHGLIRLWTRETSPFWTHNGFQSATASELEKLPLLWNCAHSDWLTLKLKDEEVVASLEKEFALFVESEKQQRHQLLSQASVLRTIVLGAVILVILAFIGAGIWFFLQIRSGNSLP